MEDHIPPVGFGIELPPPARPPRKINKAVFLSYPCEYFPTSSRVGDPIEIGWDGTHLENNNCANQTTTELFEQKKESRTPRLQAYDSFLINGALTLCLMA